MDFEKIRSRRNILASRNNDTKEKVYEFEFWDLLFNLLDCINSFDTNSRKIDFRPDVNELLHSLKHSYNTIKGNYKYLTGENP